MLDIRERRGICPVFGVRKEMGVRLRFPGEQHNERGGGMNKKRYKIIDMHGNLRSVYRSAEMMQPYIDLGLAMEELPVYTGWRSCYRGIEDNNGNILTEPYEWDRERMKRAYKSIILAYWKLAGGRDNLPEIYKNAA
jgi:hypothetical protein